MILRDPSIHIKLSDLKKILIKLDIELSDYDLLLREARKLSCDVRSVSITNEKVKKDLTKRLKSNKGDSMLLSEVIYSIRIKLKHRGIKKITEVDRDWLQLKELTKVCNQFCEEFELSKRAGYIKYIEICFSKIASFRAYLSKFIGMYESICNEYESVSKLNDDASPKETLEVHDYFVSKIADRTGIYEKYINQPAKMIEFFKVKNVCKELGVGHEDYIDAQFEALDWCQGMPTPETLNGPKAKERLQKYLFENNIKSKNKTQQHNNLWKQLKLTR